jgi:flagellar motor switch protein FliN/FliY
MAAIATMPVRAESNAQNSVSLPAIPLAATTMALAKVDHELAPEQASGMAAIERHPEWPLLARLPIRLRACIPLPHFRVSDLIGLSVGQTIASKWQTTEDVPLKIGTVVLSWSEFEVVEQRMSVRLTRLG